MTTTKELESWRERVIYEGCGRTRSRVWMCVQVENKIVVARGGTRSGSWFEMMCIPMRLGSPVIGCVLASLAALAVRLAGVVGMWSFCCSGRTHSHAQRLRQDMPKAEGRLAFDASSCNDMETSPPLALLAGPTRTPIPSPAHRMALLSAIGPWRETILLAEATSRQHPESGVRIQEHVVCSQRWPRHATPLPWPFPSNSSSIS